MALQKRAVYLINYVMIKGEYMKIEVKQYSTRWHAGFSKKIDSILTGKHHYKLILIDLDSIPF